MRSAEIFDDIKRIYALIIEKAHHFLKHAAKVIHRLLAEFTRCVSRATKIYLRKKVARSASQVSFNIIFSIFPLLICIHWLLGVLHITFDETLNLLSEFLPPQTVSVIIDYLDYIAQYQSNALIYAGIFMLITPSATALRALKDIINDIYNRGRQGRNIWNFLLSFAVSIIFLLAVYACIIILFTGGRLLSFIVTTLDIGSIVLSWNWMRFLVLFLVLSLMLYLMYRFLPYNLRSGHKVFAGHVWPGVFFSSVSLVLISILFSWFINLSTRYSLIYGSLTSIIIFMLWLNLCCNIVIIGSIVNFIFDERKHKYMLYLRLIKK